MLEQELVRLKVMHKTTADDLEAAEKQVASLRKALQEVGRIKDNGTNTLDPEPSALDLRPWSVNPQPS